MSDHKLYAHLDLKGDNVSVILVRAVVVADAFEAKAVLLSNPPIPIPVFRGQITSLEDAQLLVKKRIPNSVPTRNTARITLCNSLDLYRAYLQLTADASSDPASVIVAGGMKVVAYTTAAKPLLDARLDTQGAVVLRANARALCKSKSRFFNWQYTTDGGKTWFAAPSTPNASTRIAGLPPLSLCGFRVSVTSMAGQSDWSQSVSLRVGG